MTDTDLAATARILIVDDEPANVRLLERLLGQAGYRQLRSTTDARDALPMVLDAPPDLIILDLMMPHLDGVEVMRQVAPHLPVGDFLPVLVLTGDATLEGKRRALEAGASDFLTKPFDFLELLLRVQNLLRSRFLHRDLQRQNDQLEKLVRQRTAQLLEAERLATMGQLLAGVAHELNNPLSVIVGHAQLLEAASRDATIHAHTAKINAAADRCVRIVRNFLAMARRRPPERTSVALQPTLQGIVDLVAYELGIASIEVRLDVAPDLPPIWADGHQLQQVVINLVTNAMHAMRDIPPPRRLAIVARHDPAQRRISVVVSDSGPGVPPDLADRIFDPLFTTKPEGEGTGLGLPISRGIVEAHGGRLVLESAPGSGATFRIELPVGDVRAPAAPGAPASLVPAPPSRLLVVDDEADVAALLAQVLSLDGHVVELAASGAEALDKLGETAYDLILTDSAMPRVGGPELYRQVQQRHPRLAGRMVFVTGDVLNTETEAFIERVGAPHIRKPFSVDTVRDTVSRVLRATGDP